jgi:BirA family biotin operon repressor/biotin-[acetyl-CoA-carboxylase] ligase
MMIRQLLDAKILSTELLTSYWRVKVFDEVTSTQILLKESRPMSGNVYVAEYQSQGRGRLDRTFQSPSGSGLLFSLYLEPKLSQSQLVLVPLLVGMTVAQTLNELTGTTSFTAKWPNDVIAESGKTCGILCERYESGVIVGIGINVSNLKEELPVDSATSIYCETGIEIDRNILLIQLLKALSNNLVTWESGVDFLDNYRTICSTLDSLVNVTLPAGRIVQARALGISVDGGLILDDGSTVTAGDIVHVRAQLK